MSIDSATPTFIRNAWLQISRDKGLSSATILVMTLTLFITSIFVVLSLAANSVLSYLESRPQITIFFKTDFPEEKIRVLERELKGRSEVASVNYVSKEEGFKFYLGLHQNEQSLLESVSSDIFPAALEIKSQKISDLPAIAESVSQAEGIDEVVFNKDIVNTFKNWVDGIRFVGLGLVGVLAFISLFIILITIGMTIRSRGEEIEIINLLGATAAYIRLPFLTQGAIYGFVSGLISTSVLVVLIALVFRRLGPVLVEIPLPPLETFVIYVSLLQIVLGIILGIFGAWLSIKRYLRA